MKRVADLRLLSSLSVLLLSSSLITRASSSCVWKGQITTTPAPFTECNFFSDTDEEGILNDIIEELQVHHLVPPNSEAISALGYYILALVECDHEDASSVSRGLYSQGGSALITITMPSQTIAGRHLTWKELTLEGAIAELNDSCTLSVCDPVWVVPIPVTGKHHLMYIDISTRGGQSHHTVQSSKFTVHPDGYWRAFGPEESPLYGVGQEVSGVNVQQYLASIEPSTAGFLPPLTSPAFIPLSPRLTIFTRNFFQDIIFVEVSRVSVTRVCEGMGSFVITLHDRVLYGDGQAVLEIFGRFALSPPHDDECQPVTTINACIRRFIVPPHSHLVEWSVYAIAGERGEEIHQASLESSKLLNGQPLVFNRVLDGTGAGPCSLMDILEGSTECAVLSGAASATTPHEAFFLVESATEPGALYSILLLTGNLDDRVWRHLATVPVTNCTGVDSGLCFVSPSVTLTGITTTARPSKHLFVWGSVVLHSPDEGITWYHLADYSSYSVVTLLTTSSDGQLVILNEDQEIWYGSCGVTVSLALLRPSDGWDLRQVIEPSDQVRDRTLSLFFDDQNSLREVFTFTQDNTLKSVTSRLIPAARILHLSEHSSNIRGNGAPDLAQHICPFRQVSLVAKVSHSADRREYYKFSPPRLTNGVAHNEDSLIIYQGLLHLILDLREQGSRTSYAGDLHNPMEQWLAAYQPLESYHEYLYRNRLLHQGLGVYVPLTLLTNQGIEVKNGTTFALPPEIFLDKGDTYSFMVQMEGWPLSDDNGFDWSERILLMADVSHQDLLQISLTRHMEHLTDTVNYLVTLQDSSSITTQAPPGELLLTSSVSIEAWQSGMKCFDQRDGEPSLQGLVTMNVIHGCPPGRVLQYDINGTILYHGADDVYDCPMADPKLPCLYFSHDFHPQFQIMDLTTGRDEPFVGPYTLRMIGGQGPEEDQMRHFTDQEIAQYNWQDRNSLIWLPINATYNGASAVFDRENNGIIWRCQQHSPCGERPLNFPYSPEYIFLVEVTNMGAMSVDTYCNYTVQFLVKVHGLPISSRMSIIIVVWCLVLSFSVIILFLVCVWNNKRVWRRFKRRVQQGLRVHPKMGSTEWGIQTSASGSDTSSAPGFAGTLVTRRRIDGRSPRRSEGEVAWNLEGSWVPADLGDTLQEVTEGEDMVDESLEGVREKHGTAEEEEECSVNNRDHSTEAEGVGMEDGLLEGVRKKHGIAAEEEETSGNNRDHPPEAEGVGMEDGSLEGVREKQGSAEDKGRTSGDSREDSPEAVSVRAAGSNGTAGNGKQSSGQDSVNSDEVTFNREAGLKQNKGVGGEDSDGYSKKELEEISKEHDVGSSSKDELVNTK